MYGWQLDISVFNVQFFFKLKTAVLGISCCNFDPSLDKLTLQTNPSVDVTTLSLWGHLGDHLYVYLWCEHVQMFSFWDRVLLYSLGWPQTCNLTAWACWAMGLQMEAIAPIFVCALSPPLVQCGDWTQNLTQVRQMLYRGTTFPAPALYFQIYIFIKYIINNVNIFI